MNNVQLQDLARVGAQARLATLEVERDQLLKMFPDLGALSRPAAPKKAQGERMRAYRAAKRAGKAEAAGADARSRGASPARKNQTAVRKK
jgi:hypothetical protein